MSEQDDWFEQALRELDGTTAESDFNATEREIVQTAAANPELPNAEIADSVGVEASVVRDVRAKADQHAADWPSEIRTESQELLDADDGDLPDWATEEPAASETAPVDSETPRDGETPTADGSPKPDADETVGIDTAKPSTPAGKDEFGFGSFGDEQPQAEPAGFSTADATSPEAGKDEFGFGSFGGADGEDTPPEPTDFDDADFDSDIDRIKLGIEGLDTMIRGGVPSRSLISVIGGPGTGKTTFGLQFLEETLSKGNRAVFITLEQSEEAVLATAEEMGWPFERYQEAGLLSVVVLDPVEMANSLASIRNDMSRLISDFGADRLVLDSVSLLEMMYDHPARRRSEVFNFTRSLKAAGVTTMLTSEVDQDTPYASKHGMVEYLTDAVFFLQYVRTSDFQETRTAVEIQKIRDASHSRERKPYEITDSGISVYQQANIF